VITGLGAITPVGHGAETAYQALCAGKNGISKLPSWADEFPAQLAGVVSFDPKAAGLKSKTISRNARYTHFAMAAAKQAIEDAKLDIKTIDPTRFGVIVGSGIGGIEWLENSCQAFHSELSRGNGGYSALRTINPFLIPALIANTASGMIAIEYNAKGPNYCVTTACATGEYTLLYYVLYTIYTIPCTHCTVLLYYTTIH
jgi:3-oxoacyl-[acyl-carrier-protein] synthase II